MPLQKSFHLGTPLYIPVVVSLLGLQAAQLTRHVPVMHPYKS